MIPHDLDGRANDGDVDERTSDDSVNWSSREQRCPRFLETGIPRHLSPGFPGLRRQPRS